MYHKGDPVKLVEYAATKTEAGKKWCVFDIDSSCEEGRYDKAIKIAKNKGIKCAFSNMAFEVWLLSHYSKFDKGKDCKGLIEEVNILLKNIRYSKLYEKNDKELLRDKFIPKYMQAVQNSKIVHQNKLKDNNITGEVKGKDMQKLNSCTTVYRLIEDLELQEK